MGHEFIMAETVTVSSRSRENLARKSLNAAGGPHANKSITPEPQGASINLSSGTPGAFYQENIMMQVTSG